ncbi:MAG: glutamate synthase large subunit [Bacteroidia bacterium]|nr:glutamate synthase large subunit [Bacteroidia bacterium]
MASGSLAPSNHVGEQTAYPSMYHPSFEHDACGIGCIAQLDQKASHAVIKDALAMLENMEHRGATGADPNTGDGAGILLQIDHDFFSERAKEAGINLPEAGRYGIGMLFFPKEDKAYHQAKAHLAKVCEEHKIELLGYRKVPTDAQAAELGKMALDSEPIIEQVFFKSKLDLSTEALERKLFVFRRNLWHTFEGKAKWELHFTSLSCKTIIYKGQLTTWQLNKYYKDLTDERFKSVLAVVHSRFSTNTFPSWRLAQPFRYLAHNGEINTHKGNLNWIKAKEAVLKSKYFTKEEISKLSPICMEEFSDSRNLDSVVELLLLCGRPLPHVMMMLMPEAWQNRSDMDAELKAFYEYHGALTEAWDGPAAVCFTDGKQLGAVLDRNGLRPARYTLTTDQRFVLASEEGALPIPAAMVKERGRLEPGKMVLVDVENGWFKKDREIKEELIRNRPYKDWLIEGKVELKSLPDPVEEVISSTIELETKQKLFGIGIEEIKVLLQPMALNGKEPLGSMGVDTPLAILSENSQHISHYFKQLFAQVSNPPIDPIREKNVMSLGGWIGSSKNFLTESKEHCYHIALDSPVLREEEIQKIREIANPKFHPHTISICFEGSVSLEDAVNRICDEAMEALSMGKNILILSDKGIAESEMPIPALLATSAVHHHLIRNKKRHLAALIVETGDAREVHHFATLIGYGAAAVMPYLAFETLHQHEGLLGWENYSYAELESNYIKAINAGLLKIMSKMGISTLQSYHGAQIFEIVGLSQRLVDLCFTATVSRLGGIDFEGLEEEVRIRKEKAFDEKGLEHEGIYQWKRDGETHLYNPASIHLLQKSTKLNDFKIYKKYAAVINENNQKFTTLRSLLDFDKLNPISIDEVEPVENILKRFATGAMSFGSISYEAHSTLAKAMNRIGGKSNSGEGGEDPERFTKIPGKDWERSATKQIASGRFGVTIHYLSEADELQIKIAQGAKPGEGGQLPGYKVNEWIAKVRHSTPGVGLISPPPHHDIYSIEDLAQLIFDLKNANPSARISVKLVAKGGVGTIASGVAKAHADHILISGYDGGTGASPISSIRHAGLPWEMGLAETHQTLVKNKLRNRVVVQADGGMKTGRDLAIATLLGAEEWGVATAALVVEGCILMRKCHLNSCPVGIATQNPVLREKFTGKVEHLVNFFHFLAEDLREHMAMLGFRTVNEMVGQTQKLKTKAGLRHWKHESINLSQMLFADQNNEEELYKSRDHDHGIADVLDRNFIKACSPINEGTSLELESSIFNTNRSTGTMLSHYVIKATSGKGLQEGSIRLKFRGAAGQSFGAFGAKGIRFELEGGANDYVGKGLSGAEMIIFPDRDAPYSPGKNIIIGNVAFYGATSGKAFIRGMAGERFAVRNSGLEAVVEGLGDHGCEYMTGGRIIVLGPTGTNFGAGMSGGLAFIYDPDKKFENQVNAETLDIGDPLTIEDKEFIQEMVERHRKITGSRIAMKLLTDWEDAFSKITKVFPRDYKKVLKSSNILNVNPKRSKLIG